MMKTIKLNTKETFAELYKKVKQSHGYWTEGTQLRFCEDLLSIMNNDQKKDYKQTLILLDKVLNKKRGYTKRIMAGRRPKLNELCEIAFVLGYKLHIEFHKIK